MRLLTFLVRWLLYIPPDFNTEQFLQISRAIDLQGHSNAFIAMHLQGHSNAFIAMHWTIQLFFSVKFSQCYRINFVSKKWFPD